ncbi:MAG TPA: LacI family DNA-binding transcriptional regulator [Chloroflexota bacterium]|jgi:LacI family transcriptional regulator
MATRPTVKDVADHAGVSLATVSLVLNGKAGVGPETRLRVREAIATLGYQRRGQRPVIGLVIERLSVPAYSDPLISLIIHGAELAAGRDGYHLLLASIERGAAELPAMITEQQIGGLLVVGGGDLTDAYIRTLAAAGLPMVLVDNYVADLAIPCVLGDNVTGAYLATRHLIEQGHERIALLQGPRKYKTLTDRREGYLRAMDEADLPVDPSWLVQPIHPSTRKGYHEAQSLLALPSARRPTAIFAISDKTALGAMDALKDGGLILPDDMALVGFDDVAESALVTPSLSTVRLPAHAMGETAVQRLVELMEGAESAPSKTVLYTELLIRQSSSNLLLAKVG